MSDIGARVRKTLTLVRKATTRKLAVQTFLSLESAVTFLPWLLSWMLCAVGLAVVAGYQTAKADSEAKRKLLTTVLGGKE